MSSIEYLIKSIIRRNTHTLKECLLKGTDPNGAEDEDGITPLHYAVLYRSYDATQLLLAAGADPLITNIEGLTPIDLARDNNDEKLLLLLSTVSAKNAII